MPWNFGTLVLVVSVLVVWVVVLTRDSLTGRNQFQLHQRDAEVHHAFLAADRVSVFSTPVPMAMPEPAEKVDFLAYARFPKTGSRYAIEKFRQVIGKELRVIPEAQAVKSQPLTHGFLVGSVRNPCESYLSLWAFQSDPKRRAGLMFDLKRRHPEDYARLVGRDVSSNYTTPEDIQRFRQWIRYLAHDKVGLGLMSGRFYGKYLSDAQVNMRDNAMLVKELTPQRATEMVESLKTMDVNHLVDCWLHTESMDQDLSRCLQLYKDRGGHVINLLSVGDRKGSSGHGNCDVFFDEETAELVRKIDAPLFSKFGYTSCCGDRPKGTLIPEVVPKLEGSAWNWGDPFDQAVGRPTTAHSGRSMWKARVGPCERSVAGPNERELNTDHMLTLPSIRMALDEVILACLKSTDLPKDRTGARLMMYQGVLSGLVRSCNFLATTLDFSATEPFRQHEIDEIFEHWNGIGNHHTNQRKATFDDKSLSVFKLTGFRGKKWTHTVGRSLGQLAIFMGHADLIHAVLGNNALEKVMDKNDPKGRTLRDYLSAPGCPVYNWPMADAIADAVSATAGRYRVERPAPTGFLSCSGQDFPEISLGWTQETTWDHYHACDFEVVESLNQKDFEENYRNFGRPVLVRNFASIEDRCNLRKGFVMKEHGQGLFDLGPIAYPNLIGAQPCEKRFTVLEAEKGAHCQRHGNTSNYYASHRPGLMSKDLAKTKTFQKVKEVLPRINHMSKQYFWGGDKSGAALHYHVAAFNVLFVGEKEWYVTPPYLAARSGIATEHLFARSGINQKHLFRCTQYAGDMVLLPDGWGHATLNHGFGLGIGVLYDEIHDLI